MSLRVINFGELTLREKRVVAYFYFVNRTKYVKPVEVEKYLLDDGFRIQCTSGWTAEIMNILERRGILEEKYINDGSSYRQFKYKPMNLIGFYHGFETGIDNISNVNWKEISEKLLEKEKIVKAEKIIKELPKIEPLSNCTVIIDIINNQDTEGTMRLLKLLTSNGYIVQVRSLK